MCLRHQECFCLVSHVSNKGSCESDVIRHISRASCQIDFKGATISFMAMPLARAKSVLKAYKEENYTATRALKKVGYSRNTAESKGAEIIDNASRAVARSGDRDAIMEYLGTNPEEIAREYMAVVKQNKNYPAKLRALEPLVRKKGIVFNEEQTKVTVPVLNVTMQAPQANSEERAPIETIDIPVIEDPQNPPPKEGQTEP